MRNVNQWKKTSKNSNILMNVQTKSASLIKNNILLYLLDFLLSN